MTNPTSNFGWQMPTSTDLVTDLPADFETFGQAVDTSLADLKGGTSGQILSKASNTDMDFTWITNDVGDITAVTAGTGISGGGTSGSVTITNSMATAITTAGDLIKGTGSGTFDRLGIGSTGQVLTVSGGAPAWATPSAAAAIGCLVFSPGTSFSYTSGAVTVIPMGSELWDTDGFHSTSTNTSRITIPSGKAGKYQINGYIRTNGTAGNYAIINLLKNGSSVTASGLEGGQMVRLSPNGNTYAMSGIAILDLAVGDYIEIAYQADTSTGTYNMYAQFGVVYLGA